MSGSAVTPPSHTHLLSSQSLLHTITHTLSHARTPSLTLPPPPSLSLSQEGEDDAPGGFTGQAFPKVLSGLKCARQLAVKLQVPLHELGGNPMLLVGGVQLTAP